MSSFRNIKRFHRNNVNTLRHSALAEVSGAFGDLGTLLPLMMTLAVNGSISLSTTLVFSGFYNLATGVIFGIPLPVQPMKVNDCVHTQPLRYFPPEALTEPENSLE